METGKADCVCLAWALNNCQYANHDQLDHHQGQPREREYDDSLQRRLMEKHPIVFVFQTHSEQIQGPKGTGVVNMHLIKPANHSDFEYKYFYVDVRGHQRIYLENADAASTKDSSSKGPFKLFGVSWG